MVPDWFKVLGLVFAGTCMAITLVCIIYGTVRITFMILREWQEERRLKHGRGKVYRDH